MENINCQFNIDTSDYICSIPYIEQISYNGETSYVFNYFTSGELIISLLLLLFLSFEIFKFGFHFLFPQIIELKKWKK